MADRRPPGAVDPIDALAVVSEAGDGDVGILEKEISKRLHSEHTPRHRILSLLTGRLLERAVSQARQPVLDYCEANLPLSREQVRKLPFYDATLQAAKWQRDAYLVGPQYADQRREERQAEKESQQEQESRWRSMGWGDPANQKDESQSPSLPMRPVEMPAPGSFNIANRPRFFLRRRNAVIAPPRMPYDATALGIQQMAHLGSWFIPSDTVRLSLLPIVIPLPTHTLYEPIVTSVVDSAIPLAQDPVNRAVKSTLVWFLNDPSMRRMIKEQTQHMIGDRETQHHDKKAAQRASRRKIVRRVLRRDEAVKEQTQGNGQAE